MFSESLKGVVTKDFPGVSLPDPHSVFAPPINCIVSTTVSTKITKEFIEKKEIFLAISKENLTHLWQKSIIQNEIYGGFHALALSLPTKHKRLTIPNYFLCGIAKPNIRHIISVLFAIH